MAFKENLKRELKELLSINELNLLPSGFQTLGKAIIIKLNPKLMYRKQEIGNACLRLLPHIKSVFLNAGKIQGIFRTPENIEFIAGNNNSIVEHQEHGIIYKFDLTKIMFSKGNVNERKYLSSLVKKNEIIVDMFAGIGYFSLPIGKHSNVKQIYSVEINPLAHAFLVENIKINRLEAKIIPILGDCKEEVKKLSNSGLKADRVIMGVFPAPKQYIKEALSLAKRDGTIYHYEGVVEKQKFMDLFDEFKTIADSEHAECSLLSKRFVKSYGPNLFHVVLDILVIKM